MTQNTEITLEDRIKELEAEKKVLVEDFARIKSESLIGMRIVATELGLQVVGQCKNELDKVADLVADGDKMADRFLTLMAGKINHAKGTNTGLAQLTSKQITDLNTRAGYAESTRGLKSVTYKMA